MTKLCRCQTECMDDGGEGADGPGTCKGLPMPPRPPLVEVVLVPRWPALVAGREETTP